MNALESMDLDSGDIAAMPENFEKCVLDAIRRRLEVVDIHNWLDLYMTGAYKLRELDPDIPLSEVHKIVVVLVSEVIEDAI